MSELLKSRHAFGSEANIDSALDQGLIDAYDILFLNEGKIGWIDKDGNKVILEDKKQVMTVETLPETGDKDIVYICGTKLYFWDGEKFTTPEDMSGVSEDEMNVAIANAVTQVSDEANAYTDERVDLAKKIKYEIISKPVGTLVNYSEKEIRVMCPADTQWVKQNVGSTGNPNMYYMGFRAYAPDEAVSFKESESGVIVDEMLTFDGEFAGVDEYGRKYSVVWLPLASYDETNDVWTYFGVNSSTNKYVGWTYVVEWYNADGVLFATDSIRINLSNEACHNALEPYYMTGTLNAAKDYTDAQIANAVAIVEF